MKDKIINFPFSQTHGTWKTRQLIFFNVLVLILLWSLFTPATKVFWETIDVAFFKTINSTLRGNPNWQLFWALANHKIADLVEDLCVLCFFFAYVTQARKGLRLRRVAELLFCVLYIGLIIYFVNKTLFREYLEIPRLSPTLSVGDSVHLSQEIPWLSIKDDSTKSFPGDHGTTALLFAASFSYFAGRRLGLFAFLYAAFLCLPRLITGAHWLSDVLVGSGCITIFFLGWSFCTPMGEWCIANLERFLKSFGALRNIFRKLPS
jgi:membrane-associated phospholipid phosphatase